MNVTEPIRAHAERTPDAPAYLRTRHGTYSYRRYDAMLDTIAWRALNAGLVPGQRVALSFEREFPFLAVLLALARVGIASVRADAPGQRCDAYVVSRGGGAAPAGPTLRVDASWFEPTSESRPAPMRQGGDLECHRFMTSGTTGSPKVVAMTHDDVVARIERRLGAAALPEPPRMLSMVPVRASYGFQASLAALWSGGALVEPVKIEELAGEIDRHRVTWLVAPPGVLAPLVSHLGPAQAPFPSLERLEVSGSVLSEHLAELAAARVCRNVIVMYGSTETGIVAQAPFAELAGVKDAVGRVLRGVDVEIVDERGQPLPPGADGILRVRAPGGARRYEDDDAATPAFRDGWFYSGDLGMLAADGTLVVRGRADERLNVGGSKITPEEVESVVMKLPGIDDVAAFTIGSPAGIDRVALAIVAGPAFDFQVFKARCGEELGMFSPGLVLRMQAIPRNANGKVERASLQRLAAAHAASLPSS